jgi:hypothetical protein
MLTTIPPAGQESLSGPDHPDDVRRGSVLDNGEYVDDNPDMAAPIVQTTQATPGAGTPGEGRDDLVIGELVTVSDTEAANAGASYTSQLLDVPVGSSTVLANELTASPSFTPDVTGSYFLRMTATIGGESATSEEIYAVPLPTTGSRIPSFRETLQFDAAGNAVGWHQALTVFMRAVDTALASTTPTYELIESKQVGFAVGSLVFNGLDGDLDGAYHWTIEWNCAAPGTIYVALEPNGDAANKGTAWVFGGGVVAGSGTLGFGICAVSETKTRGLFHGHLQPTNGFERRWTWDGGSGDGSATPANYIAYNGFGTWTDKFTNITSITFRTITGAGALVATGFQPGTRVSLYRRLT